MESIRVIIADDSEIYRNYIKILLKEEKPIKIIGEASNSQQLFGILKKEKKVEVDIILLDIKFSRYLNSLDGFEIAKILARDYKNIKVIIVSNHDEFEYIEQALELNAQGYIPKYTPETEYIKSIYEVFNGRPFYSPMLSHLLEIYSEKRKTDIKLIKQITKYEELDPVLRDAFVQICLCKKNEEIGQEINRSERSVEDYKKTFKEKFKLITPFDFIHFAIKIKEPEVMKALGLI